MSSVFLMRFNDEQAAIIADESTWHLSFKYGYRRVNYGDHILPLFNLESSKRTGMAAVYTGVGFPSFHFEVAEHSRRILNASDPEPVLTTLEDVVSIVHNKYQKAHGRMVDDRMNFCFGFGRDNLNSLEFKDDNRKVTIDQGNIIQEAKKIISYQDKGDHMVRIFENNAALVGYSPDNGIQGYYLSSETKGMNFAYALSVLGEGSQVASHIFAKTATSMDLSARRQGFSLLEGLAMLLNIAVNTRMYQGKMGGYYQLAIINGKTSPEQAVVEISDHRLKLACEAISAFSWDMLDINSTLELIEGLLLKNLSFQEGEKKLFGVSSNRNDLERYLMGYKAPYNRFLPIPAKKVERTEAKGENQL